MIDGIRTFLRKYSVLPDTVEADVEQELRMAVALLLLDVARADSRVTGDEQRVARRLLERYFPISQDQSQALVEAAQRQAERATSLYPFTSLIKRECDVEERARIIEMLWKVSRADGRVDPHEEHLIRKVAELLYVPHSRFIRAKLRQEIS